MSKSLFKSNVDGLIKPNIFKSSMYRDLTTTFRICVENHVYQLKPKYVTATINMVLLTGETYSYNAAMVYTGDLDVLKVIENNGQAKRRLELLLQFRIKDWVTALFPCKFIHVTFKSFH
jgi:hypothetical protein